MKTINVNITTEQARKIEKIAKEYGFANRSEFFRAILRYVFSRSPDVIDKLDTFVFEEPYTRSRAAIVAGLRKTGKYNEKFIRSVSRGLAKSKYFSR